VPKNITPKTCNSDREIAFTQYVVNVMKKTIDLGDSVPVGRFLHSCLSNNYINASGLVRNITKFYQDYADFYGQDMPTMTQSYMQKIFNGYAYDSYFVLQIAYFMGISVQEITHLPRDTFENELYQQLSAKYHIDYAIVEDIASAVLKSSNQQIFVARKSGPRGIIYDKLDEQHLPKVINIVDQIIEADGRPQKLSFSKVQLTNPFIECSSNSFSHQCSSLSPILFTLVPNLERVKSLIILSFSAVILLISSCLSNSN
jgi:hypothetical protein